MRMIARKFKLWLVMLGTLLSMSLSGCGTSPDDYVGIWMGLDERGGVHAKVFQCEILQSQNAGNYTIRVSQFNYEINSTGTAAQWSASAQHYFNGHIDSSGNLVTDIGTIVADSKNFRLLYGNISLVRKAKNTEVKLKYVLRDKIAAAYPGISIAD